MAEPQGSIPGRNAELGQDGSDSLRSLLFVLWRSLPVIVVAALVAGGVAVAFTSQESTTYTASASVGLTSSSYQQAIVGGYNPVDPERELQTNSLVVRLPAVSTAVARRLGDEMARTNGIGTSVRGEANLLSINGTATDPEVAERYTNTTLDEFLRYRRALNNRATADARRVLNRQIQTAPTRAERRALVGQLNNFESLEALQNSGVQVLQRADTVVQKPTPIVRNGLLGAALGALLGIAVSLLRPWRPVRTS